MDVNHTAKILEGHFGERLVTQDAGIVDENINPPPEGARLCNHLFYRRGVGDGYGAWDRFATRRTDFSDDSLCGSSGRASSGDRAPHIVHDDLGAPTCQEK